MQQPIELVNGKFVARVGKQETKTTEQKVEIKQYSEEVMELRDRVIKGNQKLFEAWMQIRDMEDRDEKEKQLDRWNKAQDRLHHLCLTLQAKGYVDCLYIDNNGVKTKNCFDNPDGFWCQVCSSKYPYWQKDARNLPNVGDKKEEKNVEPL